jgi:ribosomal protein S18 acetylase RimI-like enzyme
MTIELRFDTHNIDWEHAVGIFERAPLGTREPDTLRQCFENSDLVCFAWAENVLIGMGRALSDGVIQSIIYDLCIEPGYQGSGLGKQMMQAMLDRLKTRTTVLWAVPGKEGFYKKLGFYPMTTAMARFDDPVHYVKKGYITL